MATFVPKRTVPKFQLTGKVEFTVLRNSGEGDYIDGYWVAGERLPVLFTGNIQPLKGSELMALPESDRTKESIKVYTVETLRTVEELGQLEADLIVWNGNKFQASRTMTYQMGVLDHTKTICFRLPETPNDKATYIPTPEEENG